MTNIYKLLVPDACIMLLIVLFYQRQPRTRGLLGVPKKIPGFPKEKKFKRKRCCLCLKTVLVNKLAIYVIYIDFKEIYF